MKTIQEMVQKATGATGTLLTCSLVGIKEIEAFAALVREDAIAEANAKANASWTLMCEKMVAIEREACSRARAAKSRKLKPVGRGRLLDEQQFCFDKGWREGAASVRAAIRARSNT